MTAPGERPYWIGWQCDVCGQTAIVVEPGADEVREFFLLRRGVPMRCWCRECWQREFRGECAALPREVPA